MEQPPLSTIMTEKNMIFFKFDYSDSNASEETVYTFEPLNPLTTTSFADTDVILNSPLDSTQNKNLPFSPSVSEMNSKTKDAGYIVQTTTNLEQPTSSP